MSVVSSASIATDLENALVSLRALKVYASTSEQARSYAVAATELEKVIAYVRWYLATTVNRATEVVNSGG